jgi:hypothetical protein
MNLLENMSTTVFMKSIKKARLVLKLPNMRLKFSKTCEKNLVKLKNKCSKISGLKTTGRQFTTFR